MTIGWQGLLASEWTKLRSVRSTYWTLATAVIATVGLAALLCGNIVRDYTHLAATGDLDGFDTTEFSLNGLFLAQIAVGTLGVLTITGEHATGMIRTTMTAVPQRSAVLAAKVTVYAGTVLVLGELIAFAAFGLGQAILAQRHLGASLGDPGVLRAVIGGGLYLTAVGLLAIGVGAALRRTAGALTAFFGVLFATTALLELLPTSWHSTLQPYMPVNAGTQILVVLPGKDALAPWPGLGILCLYAAAALAVGTVVLARRDL